jgi:DNA polymerase III delta prime subunit
MSSFIYKYAPTIETFELSNKEVLLYDTHLLILGGERTGKSTLTTLLKRENVDVMYIHNLKDQGIQYIRNDVKCFCQMSTVSTKQLIIDGLDELLDQSQQILLTYLDKYGHHVKFIATASNPHKIIDSFFSRFITIHVSPPSRTYMKQLLEQVVSNESIDIEPNAGDHLLTVCGSNVRIMLNYLEKFKYMGLPISLSFVEASHCEIEHKWLHDYTEAVLQRDQQKARSTILRLYQDGYSIMDIIDAYYNYISKLALDEAFRFKLIKIICKYITIFNNIHEHHIELLFFVDDCINIANELHN